MIKINKEEKVKIDFVLIQCRKEGVSKEAFKWIKIAYHSGFYKESDGCTMVPDLEFDAFNMRHPACTVHDFFYRNTQYLLDNKFISVNDFNAHSRYNRKQADLMLREVLQSFGHSFISRIYYWGVRSLGWKAWKKTR